jgi:hypothetical protein
MGYDPNKTFEEMAEEQEQEFRDELEARASLTRAERLQFKNDEAMELLRIASTVPEDDILWSAVTELAEIIACDACPHDVDGGLKSEEEWIVRSDEDYSVLADLANRYPGKGNLEWAAEATSEGLDYKKGLKPIPPAESVEDFDDDFDDDDDIDEDAELMRVENEKAMVLVGYWSNYPEDRINWEAVEESCETIIRNACPYNEDSPDGLKGGEWVVVSQEDYFTLAALAHRYPDSEFLAEAVEESLRGIMFKKGLVPIPPADSVEF